MVLISMMAQLNRILPFSCCDFDCVELRGIRDNYSDFSKSLSVTIRESAQDCPEENQDYLGYISPRRTIIESLQRGLVEEEVDLSPLSEWYSEDSYTNIDHSVDLSDISWEPRSEVNERCSAHLYSLPPHYIGEPFLGSSEKLPEDISGHTDTTLKDTIPDSTPDSTERDLNSSTNINSPLNKLLSDLRSEQFQIELLKKRITLLEGVKARLEGVKARLEGVKARLEGVTIDTHQEPSRLTDLRKELGKFDVQLKQIKSSPSKRSEDLFELLFKYGLKCKELVALGNSGLLDQPFWRFVYAGDFRRKPWYEVVVEEHRTNFYKDVFTTLHAISRGKATSEDIERDLNQFLLNFFTNALTAIFEKSDTTDKSLGSSGGPGGIRTPNSATFNSFLFRALVDVITDFAKVFLSHLHQFFKSTIPKFLNTVQHPRQSSYRDVNRFKVGLYRLKEPASFCGSTLECCAA